jgi:hypothetical protein
MLQSHSFVSILQFVSVSRARRSVSRSGGRSVRPSVCFAGTSDCDCIADRTECNENDVEQFMLEPCYCM